MRTNRLPRAMTHGYPIDVKWEFWSITAKLRNDMDQGLSFHEAQARAMEQAAEAIAARTNTLWTDRLCDPWFDASHFDIEGKS